MSERAAPNAPTSPSRSTFGMSAIGYWMSATWVGFAALQTFLAIAIAAMAATCVGFLGFVNGLIPLALTAVAVSVVAPLFVRSQSSLKTSGPVIATTVLLAIVFVVATGTGIIVALLVQGESESFDPAALLGLGVNIPSGYSLAVLLYCGLSPKGGRARSWRSVSAGIAVGFGALFIGTLYAAIAALFCL